MQLRAVVGTLLLAASMAAVPAVAYADDRVDTTVTWFQERRAEAAGSKSTLDVVHPQFDFGIDLGESFSLSAGYEADIVSGATESLYATNGVDAVSSATEFSDTRHVGKGGLSFQGRRSRLSASYSYGTERDYRSQSVSAGASINLPGKNTTFAISYTHNFDEVCDLDNGTATPLERRALTGANACFVAADDKTRTTITHDVSIDTTEASLTQNLSPEMVLQVGLNGQIVNGFQSNPYRRVRVFGVDAQEATPLVRDRYAAFARLRIAFPKAHSAIGADLRGYWDSWGVYSGTAGVEYFQYLGQKFLFRFRTRVYQQTKAVFFEDALDYANTGSAGAYYTGDRELSPLRNALFGGKMSYLAVADDAGPVWGLFDEVDFHLRAEGIWAESLTDTAPGGDVTGPLSWEDYYCEPRIADEVLRPARPMIPIVTVALDEPAETRWRGLAAHRSAVRELLGIYVDDLGGETVAELTAEAALAVLGKDELAEIEGVAGLAGCPLTHAIAANVYYDAIKHLWGCTGFVVDTALGPLHARNLDWHTVAGALSRHTIRIEFQRGGAPHFSAVGWPGFLGVLSGMAPGRFAVTLNAALSSDAPERGGRPVGLVLRDTLDQASSYTDAVARLRRATLASDALLLVSGVRQGERTVIERTPTRAAERPPVRGVLVVTNDYRALDTGGTQAMGELAATACRRFDRAAERLATEAIGGASDCLAVLSDPDVRMGSTVQQMVFQAATGLVEIVAT